MVVMFTGLAASTVDCPTGRACQIIVDQGESGFEWSALVGPAVVAGILAAAFAIFAEWNKNRLRRKGIARTVGDDMRRHQSTLARAWFRERWWEDSEHLEDRFDKDDLHRLASALKPREWATVTSALGWMSALQAARTRDLELYRWRNGLDKDAIVTATMAPKLGSKETDWIRLTYERLEAARWVLRRQSAPIAWRVPVRSVTRLHWRAHGTGQLKETEVGRALAHGLVPADIENRPPILEPKIKNPEGFRRRRYIGVTHARAWDADGVLREDGKEVRFADLKARIWL